MTEAGMVDVDEEADVSEVSLTEAAESVDVYVELVPEQDIRWSEYYLALSAFAGVFVLGAGLGVPPLDEPPAVAWLGFVTVLLVLSALIHRRYQRGNRLGTAGAPPESP
ncbi:MAG: hypothetical protein A07HB70_00343 [uncultured archaeon A07HB70]|nr:MAG: hypothetical protein A07HB70_00343 [uncultured archaeon A07HB70]